MAQAPCKPYVAEMTKYFVPKSHAERPTFPEEYRDTHRERERERERVDKEAAQCTENSQPCLHTARAVMQYPIVCAVLRRMLYIRGRPGHPPAAVAAAIC